MAVENKQAGMRRQLGLVSASAIVVGEVIAVGIFLTPAEMAKSLGSPFWLLAVWLVMGAVALSGALSYGELAARFPEAGGGYVYLREAYGPRIAFLYGWKCFLVMDPGITAALAVGLSSYVGYMADLSPTAIKAVAITSILVIAAINIRGVRVGASVIKALTFAKLGLLAVIVVWGLGGRLGDWSNFTPFVDQRAGSSPLPLALAASLVSAFFSFGGWWDVSKIAGEVREPARTMPRALAAGVVIVTAVYILTSAVFVYLVPMEQATSGETFAAQAGAVLFGERGAQVFSAIVIVSVLGSLTGIIMTAPRVYYAMARDRLFFKATGRLHPRWSTPARATLLEAALASLLVALGTFNQIVAYFIFVTVVFIALTVASVFVLRRRPSGEAVYRTPGYPVTPAVFLALAALMLVLFAANRPLQALAGVGVVLLGLPVYHFAFRKNS